MSQKNQKSQKNLKGTMEPLSLAQIKVAPLSVLQIQKKIIPSHQAELHAAVNEAMKAITRGFSAKAESTGHVQMMNRDGTPVVGAIFSHAEVKPKNYVKKYRGKKVICEMPCCTIYHPTPPQHSFMSSESIDLSKDEPENYGWIRVESRSKRNKRLRAMKERKLQNEYLYSQDEEDEYLE
jgi:hypothetical protein